MLENEKYLNRVILVGLTLKDKNECIIELYQTHGVIGSITDSGCMVLKRHDQPDFVLPFLPENISSAKKGTYREKSTGIEIVDPDFITSWTMSNVTADRVDYHKKHGM